MDPVVAGRRNICSNLSKQIWWCRHTAFEVWWHTV